MKTCASLAVLMLAAVLASARQQAQRPTFRAEFFPEEASAIPTGFSPVMPGCREALS